MLGGSRSPKVYLQEWLLGQDFINRPCYIKEKVHKVSIILFTAKKDVSDTHQYFWCCIWGQHAYGFSLFETPICLFLWSSFQFSFTEHNKHSLFPFSAPGCLDSWFRRLPCSSKVVALGHDFFRLESPNLYSLFLSHFVPLLILFPSTATPCPQWEEEHRPTHALVLGICVAALQNCCYFGHPKVGLVAPPVLLGWDAADASLRSHLNKMNSPLCVLSPAISSSILNLSTEKTKKKVWTTPYTVRERDNSHIF